MPGKRYDRQFELFAARLVLEGEIPVKGLSDQLNVPCCTLRRWATDSVFVRKAYVFGDTRDVEFVLNKVSSLIAWLWLTTY